jgi:hypothetical protein
MPRNCPETKLAYQASILVKQRSSIMLSEKFLLILEALPKSNDQSNDRPYADGSPRVVSKSPHVPLKLPAPPNEARI